MNEPAIGKERVSGVVVWCAAITVWGMLGWMLSNLVMKGAPQVSYSFLVDVPADAGRSGGIGPIIFSTLLILAVALAAAVPLSLAAAIALTEDADDCAGLIRFTRRSLNVLSAVPSIVFGLFGNAFFCISLGMGYSILSGGLTLACMVLPIMIRTTEQAIRAVPAEYRHAAAALGLSRTTTILRVVLPCASPAMAAGLVLGMGRIFAESAALIFTAGYVTRMPESLTDSGRALSVHIYDMAMNVPGGSSRSYATAIVLVTILMIVNAVANGLIGCFSRQSDLQVTGGRSS